MKKDNILPPLTKKFSDESTDEYFCFTFYCDICGMALTSPKYPFSGALMAKKRESGQSEAQRLIYEAEYEHAYEQANNEAIGYFLICDGCGKHICEDCILKAAKVRGSAGNEEQSDKVLCHECINKEE